MKKQILISLILWGSILTANAQWNGTTANSIIYGRYSTEYPTTGAGYYSLTTNHIDGVRGGLTIQYLKDGILSDGLTLNHEGELSLTGTIYGRNLTSSGNWPSTATGFYALKTNNVSGVSGGLTIQYLSNGILTDGVVLNQNGDFGIGTSSPTYKLDVCGTIRAQEVKVDLEAGTCPDFVFKSDYKLMDLKTLETYVKTNFHLPEIAPEKEMVENGLNMKELQLKLLQKIEELTLYTIEQNKKILELEKQNEKIKVLEEKIEKIEAASK